MNLIGTGKPLVNKTPDALHTFQINQIQLMDDQQRPLTQVIPQSSFSTSCTVKIFTSANTSSCYKIPVHEFAKTSKALPELLQQYYIPLCIPEDQIETECGSN